MGKVYDFQKNLEQHEDLKLNVFKKCPLLTPCDNKVRIYDRHKKNESDVYMFGSNNYLNLITNDSVINKTIESIHKYGVGSGGVPTLSGTTEIHEKLESLISDFTGFEDTILFSSGFTANLGVILGLIRPNNLVIQDKFNHASLIDGAMMSGAKMLRYKHNDPAFLEKILKENYDEFKDGILVITDGVFSMDGDIANIPEIIKIVRKYNAILLIDESHATGVIGEKGRGTLSYFNIEDKSNILLSSSLSKALGTVGGYVSGSKEIIDYLRIFARGNLYSSSIPPSVCATAIAGFEYMMESDIVEKLNNNASYLRQVLAEEGYNILNSITPVIPVIIGDEYKLTTLSRELLDHGIYISCIFPPVVSPNLSRIRINVMANHTKEDMDYLVDVLNKLNSRYSIKSSKE
ncbi:MULTISPECIES: pyridoxal phosphate-dependent aminotransferase family protein [unclassified Dysgonomonas]|uniref:aminotransferase class I/II-fold pyridoxal phosphate-dependent enzyme n=1 Tax=unclassified Dysgonomonas TaxID=2630389 RepID=UPI002476200E|nr:MULTISPECIES: pyridoxal phosphate-dependent aminotransferase family protein [unclassified Dysgonomonas]